MQVDASQVISESNESNNIPTPVSMVWHSLPAIASLYMTHPSTNQLRLNWTYPITVSRFKVYRDTIPNGTFSTLLGSPTGNTFTINVLPGENRYFYKVVAERDLP